VRRLLAVPVALVLAPTLSAAPATAVTAPTGPPPVQQLAAFQARGAVHLHWTNPAGIGGVVVRLARGRTAPAGPATGTAVAATKAGATLTGLARGTAYAVSVWTQKDGALSRRAMTSFSTTQSAVPLTGTVTGIVTDTAGHPLRGAVVDGGFFSEEQRTTSDAQGRFVLHVAPGRQWISAGGRNARGGESDRTGYSGDFAKMTVVAHTVRRGVHLVLHDAGELRGVATDARGVPLAGVAVTYIWPTPYVDPDFTAIAYAYDGLPVAHTGPRGRYTLKGAPADAVVVCFDPSRVAGRNHARAGYAQRCSDRSVAVAPGQVRTLPAEAIPPARGGMLLGTVTGPGGHPLAHASVEVERYRNPFNRDSARTDRAGTFAVTNLPAGHYRVCVSSRRTASATSPAAAQRSCGRAGAPG
jgi:hypothetical protein